MLFSLEPTFRQFKQLTKVSSVHVVCKRALFVFKIRRDLRVINKSITPMSRINFKKFLKYSKMIEAYIRDN